MTIRYSVASLTRPADTTQYAAGEVITAGTAATLKFSVPESGKIISAVLIDSAAEATKLDADLFLFNADISDLDADNAAFTPTDAQIATLVAVVDFDGPNDFHAGDGNLYIRGEQADSVGFEAAVNKTLYGVLVARNAYTPVSGEVLTVKLAIEDGK